MENVPCMKQRRGGAGCPPHGQQPPGGTGRCAPPASHPHFIASFFFCSLFFFKLQLKTPQTTLKPGELGQHQEPPCVPPTGVSHWKCTSLETNKVNKLVEGPSLCLFGGTGHRHAGGVSPPRAAHGGFCDSRVKRCFSLVLCIYIKQQKSFVCFYYFNYCHKKFALFFF